MYSVVIPVYKNEGSIPALLSEMSLVNGVIADRFGLTTEFVFVVDGSPDNCYGLLREMLPRASFPSQLSCMPEISVHLPRLEPDY